MAKMNDDCATRDLLSKYQPRRLADKFDRMESNVNRYLARAIAMNTLARLLLFTGPAGCGKGTTTRIIARRHCCANKSSHTYDPCLDCDGCRSFRRGDFSTRYSEYGYSEFDATRMEGAKIAHHIENESRSRSLVGHNRRLFCVDELQRCRTGVQERLLRLTENIKNRIIICGIDPSDILPALRDRFVHLALTPPTQKQVVAGLTKISSSEGFNLDAEAATLIARTKSNNPRRSIVTLGVSMTIATDYKIGRNEILAALEMEGEDIKCL
jgi:DNA polymerase III gamma/tau subunit